MKYIAKMMLALLASVAMVAQAYAWDFGISGSAEATFNQATSKPKSGDAITTQEFGSAAGSIVIKSSHSSGDTNAAFTYTFDWDDNYDEVVKLTGSTKVGEWTGSSAIDFNRQSPAEDRPNIAVTNGTTTIHMGLIAPVGSQSTYGGAVSGGNVAFGRDDGSIGAYIDEYQGVGVTHKVSDTITVAGALQMDKDAGILGEFGNTTGATYTNGTQTTAQAVSVSANVGPVIGFSFGTGENKAVNSNDNATSGGYKTTMTTMGLGVTMDLGGPSVALTYATISGKQTTATDTKLDDTGMGVSFSMPMGSDSVVASFTSVTQKTDIAGTALNASATGFEVGYNTKIGPVSLGLGYGTSSYTADTNNSFIKDGGPFGFDTGAASASAAGDGSSTSDLEVKMAYSW